MGSPPSPLSLPRTPPPRVDSDFMGIDATSTSFIPACSWRRVQQRPAFRSGIAYAVVEESDIEFWDHQHHLFCSPKTTCRVNSNFMSIEAIETKDHSPKEGELHEYWYTRDIPYTSVELASRDNIFQCQFLDRFSARGGVFYWVPGNIDSECDDEGRICRVAFEAKCRETTMNCAKKYSGVPLKQASVSGKS